ncbi:hematopoietic progenitor cell antigen CD34 [Pogona vitticeps]
MMLRWTFKTMGKKHLFWTAFCVLSLLVSGEDEAQLEPKSTTQATQKPTVPTLGPKEESSTKNTVTTIGSSVYPANETEAKKGTNESSITAVLPTTLSSTFTTVQLSATENITTQAPNNVTSQSIIPTTRSTASSTKQTTQNFASLPNTTQTTDSTVTASITCVNKKEVTSGTAVICLELTETLTCEQFKMQKEKDLGRVLCVINTTCHIKLSESSVKRNCILLVDVSNAGADALSKVLSEKTHDLQELGIKNVHKSEGIENHGDYSRKTLIALVTSGLLMAFLGLAGYHFMKRRSWSPRGERLGEDPYYTENGGHGNPAASVASHEQSDLQDKPNLNGGARENGTGQTASKNGHSAKPHVADTEL